eukprot:c24638_g1_i1 orf=197-967(+)
MDCPPSSQPEDPRQVDLGGVSCQMEEAITASGSEFGSGVLEELEVWQSLSEGEDCDRDVQKDEFLDMEELQFLTVEGVDKQARKILRITGKFFPASVVDSTRLKEYVVRKITKELAEEPFCVVYFNTRAKRRENGPGVLTLKRIYDTLPQDYRNRLQIIYFVHPGLLSRTIMGTFGRFFMSDGLYGKVEYISRIEFLWDHMKKGQIEVPDLVYEHDNELEHRPLMDYGLETNPFHLDSFSSYDSAAYPRHSVRWVP